MIDTDRPLRTAVRATDRVVNLAALALAILLALYSSYAIWHTQSMRDGTFLSDELAMYKPDGHDPTLDELMGLNSDVRAWLTIDGTNIDYPVVQGPDDTRYLNRNVQGEFSLAGSIFLASSNTPDFTDPYNMIYGHHVEGGAMFSDVMEFLQPEFFESHPGGILWVGDDAYRVQVFAALEVNALDPAIYQDPGRVTAEELPSIAASIVSRSTNTRDIPIVSGNSVIAMSTCENAASLDRAVVFGKLVPMSAEEIAAAEAANYAQARAAGMNAEALAPSVFAKQPWVFGGGVLLVAFLAYAAWRVYDRCCAEKRCRNRWRRRGGATRGLRSLDLTSGERPPPRLASPLDPSLAVPPRVAPDRQNSTVSRHTAISP